MSSMGEEKMDSQTKANSMTDGKASKSMDGLNQAAANNKSNNKAGGEKKKQRKPRKPPAVAWKKPKGMPKRPLSAYNLFFKVQRGAIMSARANDTSEAASKRSKKETVGIGFANLARTIADKWQSLADADKAEFLEQAAKEKARYKQEMLVWRKKQKEEKERQASMPSPTVTGTGVFPSSHQQSMSMVGGLLTGGAGGGLMFDHHDSNNRIHPSSVLHQNTHGVYHQQQQQQTNNLLFGMQHQQSPMAMQSYLQELSDSTLLQRQQMHLQELQARHQLLLTGARDPISPLPSPSPRVTNTTITPSYGGPTDHAAAAGSYPDTWFELQQSSQQQQRQPVMQMNQPSQAPQDDGELQKLTPGKTFGWQQTQLLQDQHLHQHLQDVNAGVHKDHHDFSDDDMKKPTAGTNCNNTPRRGSNNNHQEPLKQGPAAGSAFIGRIAGASALSVGGGGGTTQQQQQPSLHNLASKLDNDAISFLAEFRFNSTANSSSSSSEGTHH